MENINESSKRLAITEIHIRAFRDCIIFFNLSLRFNFIYHFFIVSGAESAIALMSLLYMLSANIGGTTKVPELIAFAL